MTKTCKIVANGIFMGEYVGDEKEATECYAKDAGYESFADLLANVPGSSRDEIEVFEIDTDHEKPKRA